MNAEASRALARDLFQLMKQLPRSRLTPDSVEGLTHSEHEFLLLLAICYDKPGAALSVTELSTLLQITPAGVTHLINPLEQAGFVERLQAPNDRRVVRIGLTRSGTRTANALLSQVQQQLVGLVNHLGEEDSKTFIRLMSKSIDFFASQPGA